jgi:hypothetical protein
MRALLQSIPVRLTSVREYARTVFEPYKRASADAPTLSLQTRRISLMPTFVLVHGAWQGAWLRVIYSRRRLS